VIHYALGDVVPGARTAGFAAPPPADRSLPFAPKTPLLHADVVGGRLFPRRDRAPAIEPLSERALRRRLAQEPALAGVARRPHAGASPAAFYTSQAMELGKIDPS